MRVSIFLIFSAFIPFIISVNILQLHYPGKSPQSIPFSIANFGQIPYGRNVTGEIHISTPMNACLPQSLNSHLQKNTFVLLALRGNCSFLTKAYIAQASGASMLIVVDNVLEMTENIIPMSSNDNEDTSNLTIPTLFIAKNDGDHLMKMSQNESINVSANFLLKKSAKVNYTFWLTSSQPESLSLVASFHEYHKRIDESGDAPTFFKAHYTGLFHCKFCNFTNYTYFPDNCISGGRYCSAYPDGANSSIAVNYIYEDLRQLCLYRHELKVWWKYMTKFAKICLGNPILYEQCSIAVLNKLEKKFEIPNLTHKIQTCFNNSFIVPEGEKLDINRNDNILLKEERKTSIDRAIGYWPMVTINDEVYMGSLAGDLVFSAICEAFEEKPRICRVRVDDENSINSDIIIMVLIMTGFVVACMTIIYCTSHKKRKDAKVRAMEISEIIGKYHVLREEKNNIA